MNDLCTAFALLTIFHFRCDRISARAFAFYPLVGLFIGVLLAAAHFVFRLALPDLVAGVLTVALWAILTGGLHLDGFTDACDALFAATTRERRLEILRDVHLGSFGAVGLILLLVLKVASVANATSLAPILLAPILGRWAMTFAVVYPPARNEGMAVLFRQGLTRREIFASTLFTAVACAMLSWFGVGTLVVAVVITAIIANIAMNRLGGLTGDIYGMICECVEVGVLVVGTMSF
ncbi:MAG: adenosylcobinamide-GDP ribazoletransferase [Chloroflexi bacterium]|nr:adenosylcobinamide-GDP ribazoletransferase [Chloroflexota bacterium]